MPASSFAKTAAYYDRIYNWKNYQAEVELLLDQLELPWQEAPRSLLDIACGTGRHLEFLSKHFHAQGLDLCPELLTIAQRRNPRLLFHRADMCDFTLEQSFDVITCLFSAIGYVGTVSRLAAALKCMSRHLKPGGILAIEPWFTPEDWKPDTVHGLYIDDPQLKLARINTSKTVGHKSVMEMHHLIGTPFATEHIVERHEIALFNEGEMRAAFEDAGLSVQLDARGLTGRGLYLGKKGILEV